MGTNAQYPSIVRITFPLVLALNSSGFMAVLEKAINEALNSLNGY